MSFKKLEQTVNFGSLSTVTWGVGEDKYYGYSVPVVLDNETSEKIVDLAKKYNAKNPVFNHNVIYLKSGNLSPKQKEELLRKRKQHIEIIFELVGYNTKNDVNYLSFKILKLRKTEKPESNDEINNEPYPEDWTNRRKKIIKKYTKDISPWYNTMFI